MSLNKSHLAAPIRHDLSATAKLALKQNLLSLEESHLDYGCGRGGDVERLQAKGFSSIGYDPYYFPGTPTPADVVTFGHVLNVIQDPIERGDALKRAWELTRKRLIVSANVQGSAREVDPGNITNIGTFSKSYSHIELKAYIESTLGFEAVKLAKDKFLISRDGRQFFPKNREEVLKENDRISQQGWVAPFYTIIKGYCSDFRSRPGVTDIPDFGRWPGARRHYRLLCKYRWLPGKSGELVRVIHIRGGLDSEHMQWAIASLQRRNRIAEMKFHCKEQSFLHEFFDFKSFEFLDTDNIRIQS